MLARTTFDINVAIIGNVSAGKSTLLNALLRAKYSEVSMKRTTAGVNYFRLHHTPSDPTKSPDATQWAATSDDPRSPTSTLKEITQDNAILRSADEISEKYFDVELPEKLFDMHPDVRLVLVDIPGINEARMGSKYKDYLSAKWCHFDCVLVVMDAKQGVNTDDQLELLKFVKQNQTKRLQPVVILCNKVDDPDDEELAELVNEARREVEQIFNVTDRAGALRHMLEGKAFPSRPVLPVFMPISASQAYFHQTVSLLSFEQFCTFDDKGLVEKYGRDNIGRHRWNTLSEDEKLRAVFDIVSNSDRRQEGLAMSNFDKFLRVLSFCVSGMDTNNQVGIVVDRLNSSVRQVRFLQDNFVHQIESLHVDIKDLCTAYPSRFPLSRTFDVLKSLLQYQIAENLPKAIQALTLGPEGITQVSHAMSKLESCARFAARENCLHDELQKILHTMIETVHIMLSIASQKYLETKMFRSPTEEQPSCPWSTLHPGDWYKLFHMLLLAGSDRLFCEFFSREKVQLEAHAQDARDALSCYRKDELKNCQKCGKLLSAAGTGCSYRVCCACKEIPIFTLKSVQCLPSRCLLCKNPLPSTGLCADTSCKCFFQLDGGKLNVATGYTHSIRYVGENGRILVPHTLNHPDNFGNAPWRVCRIFRYLQRSDAASLSSCVDTIIARDPSERRNNSGYMGGYAFAIDRYYLRKPVDNAEGQTYEWKTIEAKGGKVLLTSPGSEKNRKLVSILSENLAGSEESRKMLEKMMESALLGFGQEKLIFFCPLWRDSVVSQKTPNRVCFETFYAYEGDGSTDIIKSSSVMIQLQSSEDSAILFGLLSWNVPLARSRHLVSGDDDGIIL
jgi:small GTP-binding protein